MALKLKGPYHISHLKELTDLDSYGIYIWGFMFSRDEHAIKEFKVIPKDEIPKIDINLGYSNPEDIFIPYYVGRAKHNKKGDTTIKKRLSNHVKIQKGSSSKYLRMKMSYYKSFFRDTQNLRFPIPLTTGNWIETDEYSLKHIKKNIVYFNNPTLLSKIYNCAILDKNGKIFKANNCPINKINSVKINDTLKKIINDYNNFWFCYLPISTKQTSTNETDKQITEAEPFIFYSLKGKTVSKTKIYNSRNKCLEIKAENSCEYLFHRDNNGYLVSNEEWPGYTNKPQNT
jgi:hypothetical protein